MTQKIRSAEGLLRKSLAGDDGVVLPKEGEENILITSALPYCNNVPHLGNVIGSTLSADVFARYNRTRNRRTLYICGTDEYGTATETQAFKENLSPRELCDKYNVQHIETYKWFQLSFDHFGRTSTPLHTEIAQGIYNNLKKNGYLEKQTKEQTFCEGCNKFLADRFVEGTCPHCGADDARGDQCDACTRALDPIELINPRCLVDVAHKITRKPTAHMYARLDALQPKTEEWIRRSWKEGKWSPNAVINADGEIVDERMKGGLRPSPLTRDLKWGVPVPVDDEDEDGMRGKVFYVWFDAPIGYPSITANYTSEWKQWWFNHKNVNLYQFMGKDNVYFHTVFFPTILLGDGRDWTTLHHLSTTEYLNYEGGKFSKSKNRGVFGPAARETGIPPSVWRYYLLSIRPETSDAMFSWDDFIAANNNVLLNNFGNFVNRTIKFVASQYGGVIPEGPDVPGPISPNDEVDAEFIADVNGHIQDYITAMERVRLRLGLQTVMLLSSRGNLYLQSSGLNKALMTSEPARCAQVLTRALNLIYVLAVLIEPFLPDTATAVLEQLNAPPRTVPEALSVDLLPGHVLGTPEHLFKKIEEKMADTWREKFGGAKTDVAAGGLNADATHVVPGMSKRKAAAAKKAAGKAVAAQVEEAAGPKSADVLAWEQRVAEQGDVVRELKGKPKSGQVDADIAVALNELKTRKATLADIVAKEKAEAAAEAAA